MIDAAERALVLKLSKKFYLLLARQKKLHKIYYLKTNFLQSALHVTRCQTHYVAFFWHL